MKKRFIGIGMCLAIVIAPLFSYAGYYDYSDTLLVINDNSAISQGIGNYFINARVDLGLHVVHISTVTTETVSRTEYNANIKTAIETYITANSLHDTINYVILTKGIPIRITDTTNSVDSELADCLGKVTCSASFSANPYYNANRVFSHSVYNMYIVTRLDGYAPDGDISQITALIDNSSSANIASEATLKSRSQFILDGGGAYNSIANPWLEAANTLLTNKGWTTVLDETSTYLTAKTNVLGYWSWGSNANSSATKPLNAIPGNTYENGAIGETAVSTSARSFAYPPSYGQSLITDWIAEGISGIKGYTAEPYMSAVAHPDILFDHYTDGYNLGDSYYSASAVIRWKDIVVGDPKTVIVYNSNTATSITSFNFTSPAITGVVNNTNHTVALTVPYGTSITSLTPTISTSLGATVSPATAQNFTNPVTYTVTAMDGVTTQEYVVTVTVSPNTATNITSFTFASPAATGIINNDAHAIVISVPYGTNVTSLTPTITLSAEATSTPATGVAQNFTNPVTYTVTAMDGITTQAYVVTVTVEASTPAFELLHNFTSNGSLPYGSLILSDTKLYGMMSAGGALGNGAVFSTDIDGNNFTILHSFAGPPTDGAQANGSLTLSGTKLYGMTYGGGSGYYGTIFSMDTNGSNFTILKHLDFTSGTYPAGSLTVSGTKLYGMTAYDGSIGFGTIFSMDTNGNNFTVLEDLGGADGGVPSGDLTISDTKLYGMTNGFENTLGSIFSIDTDGNNFTLLRNFAGSPTDGSYPAGSLTLSGTKLYGMTRSGGSSNIGTLFSINTDGTGFALLKSFLGGVNDGSMPSGNLTLSGTKLYGMTEYGGSANKGILFSINTDSTGFAVLKSFVGGTADGSRPAGNLVLSGAELYGMTPTGGTDDSGILFSYAYNLSPTLAGVLISPETVKGEGEITITPVDQADPESGALNFYCNETGNATSADTLCSEGNASYASLYSSMTCSYNAPALNETRTAYCRTFDGTAYSTERTVTYVVDSTAPTLSFSNNVLAGPVLADTVTGGWGDAVVKAWDYNSTNSCPTGSGSYTKADTDSVDQSTEDNNTKYICIYGEDAVGNSTTLASDYAINIDVSPSSAVMAALVADSASQITVTSQVTTDTNGLAAAPYSFVRNNGLFTSDWQTSNVFVDTGLTSNTQYFYQVQTKDALGNTSEYLDSIANKYTLAPAPTNFVATVDGLSINLSVDSLVNATSGSSGYYFERTGGGNSGWIQTNTWQDTGLSPGTQYSYTVKYRNGDGVETTTANATATIASTDATLSNLIISSGTLTPAFASETTSYTTRVSHGTSSITVTPTKNEANATIKVNDITVASGVASDPIALNVGENTITTVVTAQDGITTETYTITVTRSGGGGGGGSISNPDNIIFSSAGFNGSISPNGATTLAYGSNQTYTITPATRYHIADVFVDSLSQGPVTTYTFSNIIASHTISATFSIEVPPPSDPPTDIPPPNTDTPSDTGTPLPEGISGNTATGGSFVYSSEDPTIITKLQALYGETVVTEDIYKNQCETKQTKPYYRTCPLGLHLSTFDLFRDSIVCEGFIVQQASEAEYRSQDVAPRKEITGVAVKMKKVQGQNISFIDPTEYLNIYQDIGLTDQANWIQPVAETALKYGIISKERTLFEPDRDVTRAEAYAMIMNSVCMTSPAGNDWQKTLFDRASTEGLTTRTWATFEPNRPILRQELFLLASKASDWAERTGGCDPKPEYCFLGE